MGDVRADGSTVRKLRYPGTCVSCRKALPAGAVAVHNPTTRKITCSACDSGSAPSVAPAVSDSHAGASARREHERRKQKDEEATRQAHPLIGNALIALRGERVSTRVWQSGARGEEAVGAVLDKLVAAESYVLHDRRIPPGRGNIDHIAITPSGVHVIDAKRHVDQRPERRVIGGLFSPRRELLYVGSRNSTKLIDGVHKQIAKVRHALDAAGLERISVDGTLCFVDADWPLFGGNFVVSGVSVLWPARLRKHLTASAEFTDATMQQAYRALAAAFPAA